MNEEAKQLLRQEFIKTIIEDEDSFEDDIELDDLQGEIFTNDFQE
jgi:hypothetical protein